MWTSVRFSCSRVVPRPTECRDHDVVEKVNLEKCGASSMLILIESVPPHIILRQYPMYAWIPDFEHLDDENRGEKIVCQNNLERAAKYAESTRTSKLGLCLCPLGKERTKRQDFRSSVPIQPPL